MGGFKNKNLQNQFDEKGYVVIDFFNDSELEILREYLKDAPREFNGGIFTSTQVWATARNQEFSALIETLAQPKIDIQMPGWMVEGGAYIVKGPKSENETAFKIHQDYNMVDENEAFSCALWIALVDTDIENGGLCVLSGSHRKFKGTIRSINIPSTYLELDDELKPLVDNVKVKAGQACIFDHSVFHGSPSNFTNESRPIIHSGLYASGSRSIHYFKNNVEGGEVIEVLEIDRKVFFNRNLSEFLNDPKGVSHCVIACVYNYTRSPEKAEVMEEYRRAQ